MKILKTLIIIYVTLSIVSCECPACFSPPNAINLDIMDKDTKINVFEAGIYDIDDLNIVDNLSKESIPFTIINEGYIINLNNIGWKTEQVSYTVSLKNINASTLDVKATVVNEDCCTFTRFDEIKINGKEGIINTQNGTFTVYL